MSEITALVERARLAAQSGASAAESSAPGRDKLRRIAAEFESMLLVQVLRDMRRAGSWEDDEDGIGLPGVDSLFETLDLELASHLARVKGMGLSRQLEEAFERLEPRTTSGEHRGPAGVGSADAEPADRADPADAGAVTVTPQPDAARAEANPVVSVLKTVADVSASAPKAVVELVKPVAGAVTSAFGWRQDPITRQVRFHQGVDLRAAYGQEVQAAAAGRVVFSGDQRGYGSTIVLQHEDGTKTRYAHLSARLVTEGERVAAGEPVGRAGRSGRATGTHLHFEVIASDGRRLPPEQWVAAAAKRE